MCDDKNIKESIPAYLEQSLEREDGEKVRKHLATCQECSAELTLFRMMTEDAVPDPGEAYWTTLPDQVHRAVQAHKAGKRLLDFSWLTDRILFPRWAVAMSAAGMVLVISWFAVHSPQKPAAPPAPEYASSVMTEDTVHLSQLDGDQLVKVSAWAGSELASIAREAGPVVANGAEADLDEELNELNSKEAERLSTMLDQWKEEG